MHRTSAALAGAYLLALASPAAATPESLGYRSTPLGREDAGQAIRNTNAILGPEGSFRLAAGWEAGPALAGDAIQVWLIASAGNPASALMEVPNKDCRCILVRIADIRAWAARGQTVDGQQGMAFDMSYLMTFMLLHETGHIAAGDAGQHGSAVEADVIGPQERLTQEQCRELRADAFAARALQAAIEHVGAPGWLEASWTANELSKLSWNLVGKRLLEHFPAEALGLAEVFGERTYSHPNTDLRVYAVNAIIAGDDTSRQLLQAFIDKRLQIGRPDLNCEQ